ncbi:MAG: pilin [bacterium]
MIKNMRKIRKNEFGFTLIEVMVVIIMLGVLAAIALPIYTNYVRRARVSEAVSTLGAIKTFLMERRNATGKWPIQSDMYTEFNDFKELYYFNKPTLSSDAGTGNKKITVNITANTTNFDLKTGEPGNFGLYIDLDDGKNSGWIGDIRDNYASHLPKANTAS